jgi:hypothetical protein
MTRLAVSAAPISDFHVPDTTSWTFLMLTSLVWITLIDKGQHTALPTSKV